MKKVRLYAKSSSREEPYEVVFRLEDNLLTVECDCPAGEWGQLCKHRLSFIAHKKAMLYDSEQVRELDKVCQWVDCSGYSELVAELKAAENELEKAKKRLKTTKMKFSRLMLEGVPCRK
jgi:uncharacterized Zn finger protein